MILGHGDAVVGCDELDRTLQSASEALRDPLQSPDRVGWCLGSVATGNRDGEVGGRLFDSRAVVHVNNLPFIPAQPHVIRARVGESPGAPGGAIAEVQVRDEDGEPADHVHIVVVRTSREDRALVLTLIRWREYPQKPVELRRPARRSAARSKAARPSESQPVDDVE